MKEPTFSLSEFIRWLEDNNSSTIKIVNDKALNENDKVYVRLSEGKLRTKLSEQGIFSEREIHEISSMLLEHGGIIKSASGSNATVKVIGEDVCVVLPKLFLRKFQKKS